MGEQGRLEVIAEVDPFGLEGSLVEGRFRVEGMVAEGGFGVVYAAHHLGLDVPVALKVLKAPPGLDDAATGAFIERFALEAKTIARLRHPHIVQALDTGVLQTPAGRSLPWIALEWLSGEPLDRYLAARAGRYLSPAQCLDLLRPVVEALAYVHDAGVAHRDVKPENVMLVRGPRGPSARLLDFGIAKVMAPDEQPGVGRTRARQPATFTPEYAAPEQVAGDRTGPWTDVHALGLLFTELLTGRMPYAGATVTDLFAETVSRRRPSPATLGVDVGPWEPVLSRALALTPEERYPTAGALLEALLVAVPTYAVPQPLAAVPDLPSALPAPSNETPTVLASAVVPVPSSPAPTRGRLVRTFVLAATAVSLAVATLAVGVRGGETDSRSAPLAHAAATTVVSLQVPPEPPPARRVAPAPNASSSASAQDAATALPTPSTELPRLAAPTTAPAPSPSSTAPASARLSATPARDARRRGGVGARGADSPARQPYTLE
jgi:serine/threonine protein kinase